MLLSSALKLTLADFYETHSSSFFACALSCDHIPLEVTCEAYEGCMSQVHRSLWHAIEPRGLTFVEQSARFWLPAQIAACPALRRPLACQQSLCHCLAILARRDSVC